MLKDPNVKGALKQEYDNMLWLYDEANKVLSDPNATQEAIDQAKADLDVATESLSNKDGFMYVGNNKDFDAWINSTVSQYAKNSAYKHTSENSSYSENTSYNDTSLGITIANRNAAAINRYSPETSTTGGPNVKYTTTPNIPAYNAPSIMNLIKQP